MASHRGRGRAGQVREPVSEILRRFAARETAAPSVRKRCAKGIVVTILPN